MIDPGTELGAAAIRLIERESVVWLTTIREDGSPWPNPVWFVWDGESFLVYSTPEARKLAHIRRDPRVTLHWNGEGWDRDIAVVTGQASVSDSDPPPDRDAAYLGKYGEAIERLGMTLDDFAATYSVPIRVRPTGLRGH